MGRGGYRKESVFLRIQAAACKFFRRAFAAYIRRNIESYGFEIKFSALMRLLIGSGLYSGANSIRRNLVFSIRLLENCIELQKYGTMFFMVSGHYAQRHYAQGHYAQSGHYAQM